MGIVELHHPVTEDKAAEFVDATYVPADAVADDEEAQQREKDAQTEALIASARENAQWRESRSADEQIKLSVVPFASAPDSDSKDGEPDASA